MKLFFFDIETTGVKHWKHGIHQISGCIEIDGVVKEYFDFKVCPYALCLIDEDALAVSGVTKEQVFAYPDMAIVHKAFKKMLGKYVDKFNKTDKFYLVGFNNANFDNQFLRTFFIQNDDVFFGSWFWSDPQDVMIFASYYLKDVRAQMLDFKLRTVATYLKIPVDETKLHDAQYDADLMRSIYHIVTNPLL